MKILDYIKMRNYCLAEDLVRVKNENGKRYFQKHHQMAWSLSLEITKKKTTKYRKMGKIMNKHFTMGISKRPKSI